MGPINRFLSKTFHLGPHDLANLSFLYFATFVMRAAAFAGVAVMQHAMNSLDALWKGVLFAIYPLAEITTVPNAEIYVIDVSFPALKDKAERDYLNNLPTSFVLPAEAVDRLRAAAKKIILESPEFQRLLNDMGERIVKPPVNAPSSSGAS